MGRLGTKKQRVLRRVREWSVPIVVAILCVFTVHQVTANPEPTIEELTEYLQSNELNVGLETVDGYRQVFYEYRGNRIYLTDDKANHSSPVASGRYVSWIKVIDGLGQVFFSDVLTKSSLQVTAFGNNSKPDIDGPRIVWQQVSDRTVQSYFWDYSSGEPVLPLGVIGSVEPAVSGNLITYALRAPDKSWSVYLIDISTGNNQVLATGQGLFLGGPEFDQAGNVMPNIVIVNQNESTAP